VKDGGTVEPGTVLGIFPELNPLWRWWRWRVLPAAAVAVLPLIQPKYGL
jgi:hypothetical protein